MKQNSSHRFDTFARKLAQPMLEAIRVTLLVFTSPAIDRWPQAKLLEYLKGAEEMARDMLREIAAKLTILPGKARAGAAVQSKPPEFRKVRAPCFKLRVTDLSRESGKEMAPSTMGRSPERSEPEGHTSNAQAQVPGEAGIAPSITEKTAPVGLGRDDNAESLFANRLSALEDVLTHPGKHAARMARALYRAEHGPGERLIARSEDDVLIDRINIGLAAYKRRDTEALSMVAADVFTYDSS